MNVQALIDTGRVLVTSGKGLWVMNRSIPICNKKICQIGDSPNRGGAVRLAGVDCAGA